MSQTPPSSEGFSSFASSQNPLPLRPLEATKWLDFLFLVSDNELERLLKEFGDIVLFRSKGLFQQGKAKISVQELLSSYRAYLISLAKGEKADLDPFYFYISQEPTAIGQKPLGDGREQIYPVLPVMIVQPGKIVYSAADHSFRKSAFSEDPILWGFKFSYPQVYLDPHTRALLRGDRFPPSPNASMLKILRQWVRDETFPVAFEADGKRQQTEFRLGNELKGFKHTAMETRGLFVSRTGSS